jgi:hypothetical protein
VSSLETTETVIQAIELASAAGFIKQGAKAAAKAAAKHAISGKAGKEAAKQAAKRAVVRYVSTQAGIAATLYGVGSYGVPWVLSQLDLEPLQIRAGLIAFQILTLRSAGQPKSKEPLRGQERIAASMEAADTLRIRVVPAKGKPATGKAADVDKSFTEGPFLHGLQDAADLQKVLASGVLKGKPHGLGGAVPMVKAQGIQGGLDALPEGFLPSKVIIEFFTEQPPNFHGFGFPAWRATEIGDEHEIRVLVTRVMDLLGNIEKVN